MNTETPQFDEALRKYFADLELDERGGQWRKCRLSGLDFYVRPEDVAFYKRIGVPLPTLAPRERIRRRLAVDNVYFLFKTKSALSGQQIISKYPPNTPYKIHEQHDWFGRNWDAADYGFDYDSDKNFFEQFKKLQLEVPRPALYSVACENSDYTNTARNLKNCYLVFDALNGEDSAYTLGLYNSKNCHDCFMVFNTDICYGGFQSSDLWRNFFVEYSQNCLNSYFLHDCRNCENCFGCTNLRHKKYYFFNAPLSKEEYEENLKNINLGNYEILKEFQSKFAESIKNAIYRPDHNNKSVNVVGDYMDNCKNCYMGFYQIECENMMYSIGGMKNKDSYDILGCTSIESCYETALTCVSSYNLKFSLISSNCRDSEFLDHCTNCHDCFGCVGLRDKSFCVFNKQYSEDEYWKIVDEIKTKMLKEGTYGEFWPPELMTVPYNISVATSYKGYDDLEEAKKYGYRTEDIPESEENTKGEVLEAKNLSADIKDVKDDILEKVIFDSTNNKKFRYIKKELDFYREHNLPLPREHWSVRFKQMRDKFGTIALNFYERKCACCGKMIETVYPPDDPRTVYCEQCYNSEVV